MSAEEIGRKVGQDAAFLLRNEVLLLQVGCRGGDGEVGG